MRIVRATVYGCPIPQGSTRAFNVKGRRFPTVTSDNPRTRPWRYEIVAAVRAAMPKPIVPTEKPCAVRASFYLPRPISLAKKHAEPSRTRTGDLDKLERALLDALTAAGIWKDDAQVVAIRSRKAFAAGHADPEREAGTPRLELEVLEYEEADPWTT